MRQGLLICLTSNHSWCIFMNFTRMHLSSSLTHTHRQTHTDTKLITQWWAVQQVTALPLLLVTQPRDEQVWLILCTQQQLTHNCECRCMHMYTCIHIYKHVNTPAPSCVSEQWCHHVRNPPLHWGLETSFLNNLGPFYILSFDIGGSCPPSFMSASIIDAGFGC